MGEMLSIKKAAKEVGVDRNTIARWVTGTETSPEPKLKRVKTGKVLRKNGDESNLTCILVDVDEVAALAAQISVGASPRVPAKGRKKKTAKRD